MVSLLIGKKGSGKTKKLIACANKALESSKGNVVVMEKGAKLTYDIPHEARLIDTDSYSIKGAEALIGFISGICAGNYDVTDILVDSTLKIIGTEAETIECFITKMKVLSESANTNIVFSVSMGSEELPKSLCELVIE